MGSRSERRAGVGLSRHQELRGGAGESDLLRSWVESLRDFCRVEEHGVEAGIGCVAEVVVSHIG